MNHYDDQKEAEKLDAQRAAADLSNSRADMPREYQNSASTAEYYLDALKIARELPCICGMCIQSIDKEIKETEKLL